MEPYSAGPRLVDSALYQDILSDTLPTRDSPGKQAPRPAQPHGQGSRPGSSHGILSSESSTAALNSYLSQEVRDDVRRTLGGPWQGSKRVSFPEASSSQPARKAVEEMHYELGRAKSELAQADRCACTAMLRVDA